jgi:hypothetical protein
MSNETLNGNFAKPMLALVILQAMKKDANYDNGSLQSGVFSSFQLSCIINKEDVSDYKIRKELNRLKGLGFVDLKKFSVDNESNLKCWKWVLTDDGYNEC